MADETNAGMAGDSEPVSVITIDKDTDASSVHRAARALAEARTKGAAPATGPKAAGTPDNTSDDGADGDERDQSADEADTAPPDLEANGETTEPDPAAGPPIEAPKSWAKDKAKLWSKLDRATQEYLAEHDRTASNAVRDAQNAAAEKAKGIETTQQAMEKVRQSYEAALPQVQSILQQQIAGEFADIKTMADVEKMASEDWPRYVKWDAAQKKLAAVTQQANAAKARQDAEARDKLAKYNTEQDAAFLEKAPDLQDKATFTKAAEAAVVALKDIGFTDAELNAMWNGTDKVSLRDHRIMLLVRDAVRYREAQAAAKRPAPKPIPQVQKPSASRPAGAEGAQRAAQLTERLAKTGSLKDGVALLRARRAG